MVQELTVRFDYYQKLSNIFTMTTVRDRTSAKMFSNVLKNISENTSQEKSCEIMQKDIVRKIHNFLLNSHV